MLKYKAILIFFWDANTNSVWGSILEHWFLIPLLFLPLDFPCLLVYRLTGRESNVRFANHGLPSVRIVEGKNQNEKLKQFYCAASLTSCHEWVLEETMTRLRVGAVDCLARRGLRRSPGCWSGLCGCLLAGHRVAGGSGGHGQTATTPSFAAVCSGVPNRQGRLGGLPPCFGHPGAALPPASARFCGLSLSCSGDTHGCPLAPALCSLAVPVSIQPGCRLVLGAGVTGWWRQFFPADTEKRDELCLAGCAGRSVLSALLGFSRQYVTHSR